LRNSDVLIAASNEPVGVLFAMSRITVPAVALHLLQQLQHSWRLNKCAATPKYQFFVVGKQMQGCTGGRLIEKI